VPYFCLHCLCSLLKYVIHLFSFSANAERTDEVLSLLILSKKLKFTHDQYAHNVSCSRTCGGHEEITDDLYFKCLCKLRKLTH
jgi:hypothetical protein